MKSARGVQCSSAPHPVTLNTSLRLQNIYQSKALSKSAATEKSSVVADDYALQFYLLIRRFNHDFYTLIIRGQILDISL